LGIPRTEEVETVKKINGGRWRWWCLVLSLALLGSGCGGGESVAEDAVGAAQKHLPTLLASDQLVLGLTSGPHTRDQGGAIVALQEVDYVFYSLESGPFDIPALEEYLEGMREAAERDPDLAPLPVLLRIPALRDVGDEATREHVRRGLAAGVDGIVFPHIENAEQAAQAVAAMGDDSWPGNPAGSRINVLLIEDIEAVEGALDIARTPGVSMVGLGPSDLTRAYEGDMDLVEQAILTVLAACVEAGIPCSTTANQAILELRLDQGFRVFTLGQAELVRRAREIVSSR
jgi:2-keto-3-deoxy-L-rhamnonate aldolase RhmA